MLRNSVWRPTEFTVVCVTVFLVWSWFNAYGCMSLECVTRPCSHTLPPSRVTGKPRLTLICSTDWTTLFFQDIQNLSALEAALRFLSMVFVGLGTNMAAELLVDNVSAGVLVSVSGLVSAGTKRLPPGPFFSPPLVTSGSRTHILTTNNYPMGKYHLYCLL